VTCTVQTRANRLDLNNPPTSVGGIQELGYRFGCRPDLNNPPTPVGGISEFSHSLYREVVPTSPLVHMQTEGVALSLREKNCQTRKKESSVGLDTGQNLLPQRRHAHPIASFILRHIECRITCSVERPFRIRVRRTSSKSDAHGNFLHPFD
jgi:hypothetical protein